jgi:hypothetical protein
MSALPLEIDETTLDDRAMGLVLAFILMCVLSAATTLAFQDGSWEAEPSAFEANASAES